MSVSCSSAVIVSAGSLGAVNAGGRIGRWARTAAVNAAAVAVASALSRGFEELAFLCLVTYRTIFTSMCA